MWHMLEKLTSLIFRPDTLEAELINVVYFSLSDLLLFSIKFVKAAQDTNRGNFCQIRSYLSFHADLVIEMA